MLIKSFSDDWKWWIWNYVKSEKNKENLFVILLNHGFEYDLISQELGYYPTNARTIKRRDSQKALDNNDPCYIFPLYKPLSDNPLVHRIENNFLEIYECDNFLNTEECDTFVAKIGENLQRSTVTNPEADQNVRTSSTAFLRIGDYEPTRVLNDKMHAFMRWPMQCAEEPQGQRYEIGQEFKQHCDWFDTQSAYNVSHLEKGQRTWTLMVYLNDVDEGGGTRFTKLDMEFKPRKGKAVIWNNLLPNMKGNAWSEHWGMPVVRGQKNIITKWFRELNPMSINNK
jgi:prolyl 4-hydroxylase